MDSVSSEPTSPSAGRGRARLALGLGATIGLLIAAFAILEPAPTEEVHVPADAAALVNGYAIPLEDYQRALRAVATDSREVPDEETRAYVLDRLIEQELLVQKAIELGFDRRDRTVRNVIISAMVQTVLDDAASTESTPAEIEAFYEENQYYFARTGRVRVREVRIPVLESANEASAREAAEAAATRLRLGEPFDLVAKELGTPPIAPIPGGYLPPAQLRRYVGPTPAEAAFALRPGDVSDPIRGGSAYHVIEMIDREAAEVPPLEDIRRQVIREMDRRAGDLALQVYVQRMMQNSEIHRAKP